MAAPLRIISSMATKALLTELLAEYQRLHPDCDIELESVGGVDAARRVQAGEAFDAVILASNAIDQLITDGRVLGGSRADIVRSGVAVAVPQGAPLPRLDSEDDLRQAVLSAPSLGYSTGPSGVQLARLFERWGIEDLIRERIITPPPGVPVASLVAKGEVALGFQQLSEMLGVPGITVVGPLPPAVQIVTVFSGGVTAASAQALAVRALLQHLCSDHTVAAKRRHGMDAA
jgi:molybdate transport system substrate-binding protein